MLPGAAPPRKVDTNTAVSFDEPVVTKTLETVTKVGYYLAIIWDLFNIHNYKRNDENVRKSRNTKVGMKP